jgi:hypothetical protein
LCLFWNKLVTILQPSPRSSRPMGRYLDPAALVPYSAGRVCARPLLASRDGLCLSLTPRQCLRRRCSALCALLLLAVVWALRPAMHQAVIACENFRRRTPSSLPWAHDNQTTHHAAHVQLSNERGARCLPFLLAPLNSGFAKCGHATVRARKLVTDHADVHSLYNEDSLPHVARQAAALKASPHPAQKN